MKVGLLASTGCAATGPIIRLGHVAVCGHVGLQPQLDTGCIVSNFHINIYTLSV